MSETIKLNYPIESEGNTVTEITLRRPKARDLKKMERGSGGDIAKSIEFIADLAELPPSAIEELDGEDFQSLSEVVARFLGKQ